MKHSIRTLAACLLSLVMVFGTLGLTAFAATDDTSRLQKLLSDGLTVRASEKGALEADVNVLLDWQSGSGVLYLPGSAKSARLTFSWTDENVTLSVGDKTYRSGKAPVPVAGKTVDYTVTRGKLSLPLRIRTMKGSATVKPMFLDLDESLGTISAMNLDTDHETSCYGKAICGDVKRAVSIKGRGNSTWIFPKKPYNITFYKDTNYDDKKKTELIDGVKAKKWTLTANYFDNSLLRSKLAMDLASDMGIGLAAEFVDLYMNGEYLGVYTLTPKKDSFCPDDGYILENDHQPIENTDEEFLFPDIHQMPLKHNILVVDDIGDNAAAAGEDIQSIEKYFTKAFRTVLDYDSEDYQDYFDIESWAKMYLMFEVSKTYDCYAGNILMHRDGLSKSDKFIAGPAWDYDVAFGRTLHKFLVGVTEPMQLNAEGWYNDSIGYNVVDEPVSILQALGMHGSFMKEVSRVYNEYRKDFEGLPGYIETQRTLLRKSAKMDNRLWGVNHPGAMYLVAPETMKALGTGKYKLDYEVTLNWDNYVDNLSEYCVKRTLWLSDHLAPGATVVTTRGGTVQL